MNNEVFDFEEYKALKGKAAIIERIEKGRQPVIDIAGYPFYVNVRAGLLQPKDDFSTMGIELDKLQMHPTTRRLIFYFDTSTRRVVQEPTAGNDLTNIAKVDIPNMYYLDPVGMALKNDKGDPRYYIRDGIALRMYHKAKVFPLADSQKQDSTSKSAKQKIGKGI